jgi:hypothetical protein
VAVLGQTQLEQQAVTPQAVAAAALETECQVRVAMVRFILSIGLIKWLILQN